MGAVDTIRRPVQLPSAELNLSGTSTSEKVFLTTGGLPLILPFPSAGELAGANGKKMSLIRITAAGRVTGGTTTNWTMQLQYGTSATPSSNTDIESGAAVAVNSVSGQWCLIAHLMIDNTSGKIDGFAHHIISGSTVTYTAVAKADNTITGVVPDGSATLGFVLTGTFSSGNASNVAYVDVFQLEMLG